MLTTKPPVRSRPAARATTASPHGLDTRVLALASLASVLGLIVGRAFGNGFVAPIVCAAILPWITAFLTHPGPHRVRRVAAVLLFASLVAACRRALAVARVPGTKPRERAPKPASEPAQASLGAGQDLIGPTAARLTKAWLGQMTLTAAISLVPAAFLLPALEAIGDPASPAGPTVRVPKDIVTHAGHRTAIGVSYLATAVDHAGNPLAPKCEPPSGALFKLGNTRVACSATEANGKRALATFIVIVRPGGDPPPPDRDRPALIVPHDLTHDATGPAGARVTYAATAHDARDGALTPHCVPASGNFFALGVTTVKCTATDAAGNTSRGRFNVVVVRAGPADHTAPIITVPEHIETPATSDDGAKLTYSVLATDNRDGSLRPSCEPPSGGMFKLGTTTVTCSAQDSAGNKADPKSFKVTVTRGRPIDRTPPVITASKPIEVPAMSEDGAEVKYLVSATDDRDGSLRPSCEPPSGGMFKLGTTTVTCSAQDSAGNKAHPKSFSVTVIDSTPAPMRITATASAIRDSYTGACPPAENRAPYVKAVVSVSRGPVTVQYKWDGSHAGADRSTKTITFTGSGPQQHTVYFTHEYWPIPGDRLTAWVALFVQAPTDVASNRVSYTVTCELP